MEFGSRGTRVEQIKSKTLRLFVVEKEEIYRHIYQLMSSRSPVELLGVSDDCDIAAVRRTISTCHPDVLLLGSKKLEVNIIEGLEQIRRDYPEVGIVLLFGSYSTEDIEILRKVAGGRDGGVAVFLRQSLDQIDQLVGIITAVSHGQVILDPMLANFILAEKPECPYLRQLTSKELEILDLLAKGYTNISIADALYINIKTVEHHLNNVYSKFKTDADFSNKHLRVSAARLYLQERGELVAC
ncbi:LuxR C-terminal-related transcriptional regulator [Chloroflexota bacterium]